MLEWLIQNTLTALLALIFIIIIILFYLALFVNINFVKGHKFETGDKDFIIKNKKRGNLPPVYPNGWFAVLESSELKKGQVKHVIALGENFAIYRTVSGIVKILDAYCPHLGANLGQGLVKGECLECPFHHWLFRGDGHCENIPYSEKVPVNAKTKTWESCEVNHLIFVWYHAESDKPNWRPQPVEKISNGTWRYQGKNEFYINSHIQDIPENGADVAHLNSVHGPAMFLSDIFPGLMRHSWTDAKWTPCKNDLEIKEISAIDATISNGVVKKKNCEPNEKHKAILHLKHSLILFEKYKLLELSVKAMQIGPGYVELQLDSFWGPMYILQTVTPVGPMLQRVTHHMYSSRILGPYAKIVIIGETFMFQRDIEIWNNKTFTKTPLLVKQDRAITEFRKWYSQFYSDNSPTFQSASKSLDW
ncbi:cholesterol 7-desaturase nvd 1 [Leptopilina boulardi]|uniref:cholesterol 7-desaturase nvd 1 n=1 Tax=Leptopilina boulardi TaxID=63433 RepID=UPI0021F52895|nr:cholesterol 7-desaturase nvd 1 [Leptopilina boulardi]XP_051157643.1 cholesterol 7-desaturase nvd 1 [Leptopilina boulardi]